LTDWNAIRKEFEETTITMKALAEKHGVKPSTLRSRKNREDWQRGVATQRNESSDVATDKPGGQKGNKNAKGNSGGKAPPNNKNAVTHGLFSKWLPDEIIADAQRHGTRRCGYGTGDRGRKVIF